MNWRRLKEAKHNEIVRGSRISYFLPFKYGGIVCLVVVNVMRGTQPMSLVHTRIGYYFIAK